MLFIWIYDHLLFVVALSITIILCYYYLIEKGSGAKLSRKYRDSIYEAQSKIFLNATQYLIRGNKDLAIKEFLSAVDLNRETVEIYFALGGLFRSNGEIEKAISIHRSLMARHNLTETSRLRSLRELALDFDKGGFLDKAIETYKDVLKINRDQHEVILALCKIYENLEEWDDAYKYRLMLSKVVQENQSETISHILVQKANIHFESGEIKLCLEELENAFQFAPSVSAKILRLKLYLVQGKMEDAKALLVELLKEHPPYSTIIFMSPTGNPFKENSLKTLYDERLKLLKEYFLSLEDQKFIESSTITLTKIRLLKENNQLLKALEILKQWIESKHYFQNEVLKTEYIKLLIDVGQKDEAIEQTKLLLASSYNSLPRYYCNQCGFNSDHIFWRCPQCHEWETIQFR